MSRATCVFSPIVYREEKLTIVGEITVSVFLLNVANHESLIRFACIIYDNCQWLLIVP